jgi:hypothetical protein
VRTDGALQRYTDCVLSFSLLWEWDGGGGGDGGLGFLPCQCMPAFVCS